MPSVAFDTNILAYAAGLRQIDEDQPKIRHAEMLVSEALANDIVMLPVQTCLELHHLLVRKGRFRRADAERVVEDYAHAAQLISTDFELTRLGFALAERHRLQIFDAVILAAAASAGCEVIYSEDMQHGFEWAGVMVVNPFA